MRKRKCLPRETAEAMAGNRAPSLRARWYAELMAGKLLIEFIGGEPGETSRAAQVGLAQAFLNWSAVNPTARQEDCRKFN